jgi:hypothetical protein
MKKKSGCFIVCTIAKEKWPLLKKLVIVEYTVNSEHIHFFSLWFDQTSVQTNDLPQSR